MSEDAIIIEIDDSQLDIALIKLDLIGSLAKKTTGRVKLDRVLPSINRDMRIILTQMPGMREAVRLLNRARILERGVLLRQAGKGSLSLYLSVISTAIILIREIQIHQKRLERTQEEYENLIRRQRGWTQEQLVQGRQDWENYLRGLPP